MQWLQNQYGCGWRQQRIQIERTQIPGQEANGAIAPGHSIKEVWVGVGGTLNHWPIGQHQLVAFANVLEQTVPGVENVSQK